MEKQQLTFSNGVASRVERLLARCDRIRRGTEIDRPTTFDRAGEAHAREIARKDPQ